MTNCLVMYDCRMPAALVVGSANADLVYTVNDFPQPGETIQSLGFQILAGGKGANQAVACARMGTPVEYCACLGTDSFGSFLWDAISTNNVQMRCTQKIDGPSGSAVIFVNRQGENQIVISPGANGQLTPNMVQNAISAVDPELILVQLESPDDAVQAILASNRKTILNPAPMRDLGAFDLSTLFAITPNESECHALTGIRPESEADVKAAAQSLLSIGVKNVVLTLGRRGSYWTDGEQEAFAPAPAVTPVDTTGAGDVFNGILLSQLANGEPFPAAIAFATKGASLSTTRPGALQSAPNQQELLQFDK